MTTKQSARLHLESVNRDCLVVLHTLPHLSAFLAMTRSGHFKSPNLGTWRKRNTSPSSRHKDNSSLTAGWTFLSDHQCDDIDRTEVRKDHSTLE